MKLVQLLIVSFLFGMFCVSELGNAANKPMTTNQDGVLELYGDQSLKVVQYHHNHYYRSRRWWVCVRHDRVYRRIYRHGHMYHRYFKRRYCRIRRAYGYHGMSHFCRGPFRYHRALRFARRHCDHIR